MITVLAVETLSVSVLAWMPLQVSVTLATVLTPVLLPWALLSVRHSLAFALMTLAMLAMLWRGEARKTVFLQSEQQVSELQQRQEQRASSKPKYLTLAPLPACDDAHRVLPQVLHPFLAEEFEETHRSLRSGIQTPEDQSEHHKGNHKAPVDLQPLDLEAYLALVNAEPDFEPRELHLGSHIDFRRSGLELPTQSDPTSSEFI